MTIARRENARRRMYSWWHDAAVFRRGGGRSGNTVSLCDYISGEFVPYKQIDIIAKDDNNAIHKADEWVASIPELIEEETWLIIKHEARSILPKKIK